MPIVVTCPACQRKARVPDPAVGKTVKCPGCGATFPAVSVDTPPPTQATADTVDVPDLPETTEADARRVTRAGVGLLTGSQALLSAGTGLKLLFALVQLVTADGGGKSPFQESLGEFVAIATTLALSGGIIAALIGSAVCTIVPGPITVRAAAASILVLSVLSAIQSPSGSLREVMSGLGRANVRGTDFQTFGLAGLMLLTSLASEMFEAARQAMLALYARSYARRVGDRITTGLGVLLAVVYPAVVVGLTVLGVVVTMFSSKTHPTFDQVLSVLVLLAKTVLIALGAFVLLRVWLRLGAARA